MVSVERSGIKRAAAEAAKKICSVVTNHASLSIQGTHLAVVFHRRTIDCLQCVQLGVERIVV